MDSCNKAPGAQINDPELNHYQNGRKADIKLHGRTYEGLPQQELERVRHCIGCKYHGICGYYGCCNYLLITGNKRPCKYGGPCSVKVLRKDYTLPDNYYDWVEEIDRIYAKKNKATVQSAPSNKLKMDIMRAILSSTFDGSCECIQARRSKHRKRCGRQSSFDIDYAWSLYCAGYYLFEISEILSVSRKIIQEYVTRHYWMDIAPSDRVYHRHNVESERKRYQAFQKRLEELK